MAIYKPKRMLSSKSFSQPREQMTLAYTLASNFRTKSSFQAVCCVNWGRVADNSCTLRYSQFFHMHWFGLNLSDFATHASCVWGEGAALFAKKTWIATEIILFWATWDARSAADCVTLQREATHLARSPKCKLVGMLQKFSTNALPGQVFFAWFSVERSVHHAESSSFI